MKKRQIFARCDLLKSFKENTQKKYPNCAFFNHEINGKEFDINSGFDGNVPIAESFITDGEISLQKKNLYSPSIVWQESIVTLENGTSISITIEHATFMIVITNRLGESQVDIHVKEEDKQTLTNILKFFYDKQLSLFQTSSIRFTSPTVLILESIANGTVKQETFDFSIGTVKERQYGKRKNRKRH